MTPAQMQAAQEIIAAFDACTTESQMATKGARAVRLLRELVTAPVAQEPVAWRFCAYDGGRWVYREQSQPEPTWQPLYAAPVAAQGERQPDDDDLAQIGYTAASDAVGWGEMWADLEEYGDTRREWLAGAKAIRDALSRKR